METQETDNEPIKEKPIIDETEAIPRAENLLLPLEELLAAGLHIGTRIKTVDMERYIFRVRPDGLFILNIGDTNEKIRISARFMARFDPARVLSVSSRLYGKTPVEKFAEVTKTSQVTGRFMPGLISNPLQPRHAEPQIVLVTDPRADYQAIKEASSVGIPVENPEDSLPSPSRSILFRQKATITQTDRRLLSSQTRTGRDSTDTIGRERQVAHWLGCATRWLHVFWAHRGPCVSKACCFRRAR